MGHGPLEPTEEVVQAVARPSPDELPKVDVTCCEGDCSGFDRTAHGTVVMLIRGPTVPWCSLAWEGPHGTVVPWYHEPPHSVNPEALPEPYSTSEISKVVKLSSNRA